ncbi:MAG: baseplate assembly protein [Novosphingobium sp.]
MSVSADVFTGVDLSRLPPPVAIEELDFETLRAAWLARFGELVTQAGGTFDAVLESDPVVKLIELGAYREMVWRAARNAGLRSVMVAYASGPDLDALAALLGVERFILVPADPVAGTAAIEESDDDFRRRLVLAPEGFSVAGPRGAYIFHALSADADVLDVSAVSPSPGEVVVTVLSRSGTGAAPGPVLAAVDAALTAQDVRPITDHVTVQAATIIDFAIVADLTFFTGPDKALVLANAQAALDEWLAVNRRLGRTGARAGIIAALMVEGMQNVNLISPAADVAVTALEAWNCSAITLNDAGYA